MIDVVGIGMTSQRTRARLVTQLSNEGIQNNEILGIMGDTPRHLFVDEALSHRAYENDALPIGLGQTISQPYIVAKMSELALLGPDRGSVLEIGTGCGYQTSVLAQLFDKVYTIERLEPLQRMAKDRLSQIQINNVKFLHGDGFKGWPEQGPYSAIVVTAAPNSLPDLLIEQLADNGVMIIPLSKSPDSQMLTVIQKTEDGIKQHEIDPVKFVPMLPGAEK